LVLAVWALGAIFAKTDGLIHLFLVIGIYGLGSALVSEQAWKKKFKSASPNLALTAPQFTVVEDIDFVDGSEEDTAKGDLQMAEIAASAGCIKLPLTPPNAHAQAIALPLQVAFADAEENAAPFIFHHQAIMANINTPFVKKYLLRKLWPSKFANEVQADRKRITVLKPTANRFMQIAFRLRTHLHPTAPSNLLLAQTLDNVAHFNHVCSRKLRAIGPQVVYSNPEAKPAYAFGQHTSNSDSMLRRTFKVVNCNERTITKPSEFIFIPMQVGKRLTKKSKPH
jgi:hypothetical protein